MSRSPSMICKDSSPSSDVNFLFRNISSLPAIVCRLLSPDKFSSESFWDMITSLPAYVIERNPFKFVSDGFLEIWMRSSTKFTFSRASRFSRAAFSCMIRFPPIKPTRLNPSSDVSESWYCISRFWPMCDNESACSTDFNAALDQICSEPSICFNVSKPTREFSLSFPFIIRSP